MAGASNNKGKVKPFKRGSAKAPAPETVPYGKPSVMLDNIKKAAAASRGAKPQKAKTITTDWRNPSKQQMENIRQLASAKPMQGDNPYKGK